MSLNCFICCEDYSLDNQYICKDHNCEICKSGKYCDKSICCKKCASDYLVNYGFSDCVICKKKLDIGELVDYFGVDWFKNDYINKFTKICLDLELQFVNTIVNSIQNSEKFDLQMFMAYHHVNRDKFIKLKNKPFLLNEKMYLIYYGDDEWLFNLVELTDKTKIGDQPPLCIYADNNFDSVYYDKNWYTYNICIKICSSNIITFSEIINELNMPGEMTEIFIKYLNFFVDFLGYKNVTFAKFWNNKQLSYKRVRKSIEWCDKCNDSLLDKHKKKENGIDCSNNKCTGKIKMMMNNVTKIEELKCDECNKIICVKCYDFLEENHKCNSEKLSIALIQKESKACPNCGERISKVSGCDHMFCTTCHTMFNWSNLKITKTTTNPHYYEWLRSQNIITNQVENNHYCTEIINTQECDERLSFLDIPQHHELYKISELLHKISLRPINTDALFELRIVKALNIIDDDYANKTRNIYIENYFLFEYNQMLLCLRELINSKLLDLIHLIRTTKGTPVVKFDDKMQNIVDDLKQIRQNFNENVSKLYKTLIYPIKLHILDDYWNLIKVTTNQIIRKNKLKTDFINYCEKYSNFVNCFSVYVDTQNSTITYTIRNKDGQLENKTASMSFCGSLQYEQMYGFLQLFNGKPNDEKYIGRLFSDFYKHVNINNIYKYPLFMSFLATNCDSQFITKFMNFLTEKVMPTHLIDKIYKSFDKDTIKNIIDMCDKIMSSLDKLMASSYFLDFHLKCIGPVENEIYKYHKYSMLYKYYLFKEFL